MILKELLNVVYEDTYVIVKSQDKTFEGYLGDIVDELYENDFDSREVKYIEIADEKSVYDAKLKILVGDWKSGKPYEAIG